MPRRPLKPLMWIVYALALGLAAFLLEWIEYRAVVRAHGVKLSGLILAAIFLGLGVWVGLHLRPQKSASAPFAPNAAAIRELGLTARECSVLTLLSEGRSNKEIARALGVSPNTVKTHVAGLFAKLGVGPRWSRLWRPSAIRCCACR